MQMPLRFLLLLTVSGSLVVAGHVYLYRRLVRDVTVHPPVRRVGAALVALLALCLLGGRLMAPILPAPVDEAVARLQWFWMGLSLYLVLGVLVLGGVAWGAKRLQGERGAGSQGELQELGVSLERRMFLSRAVAGGAMAVGGGVGAYGTWRAYERPEVSEVVVPLPGLPRTLDGFTLVQLSDIHVGPLIQRRFMETLVEQVNGLKPDLLAVTGDLVDGRVPELGHAVAALGDVRARFGRYFVTGNHEYYSGADAWCSALERMGVQVLRNRNVTVGDAGGGFDLVGVDDWSAGAQGFGGGYDLDVALTGRRPDLPAVLLAHQPRGFEEAVSRGVGLQLSGHTHAGQMFPGTLVTALMWKYNAGLYTHGAGRIYVCRGTGFWGPPMRVGSPPEIVKVVLTAA